MSTPSIFAIIDELQNCLAARPDYTKPQRNYTFSAPDYYSKLQSDFFANDYSEYSISFKRFLSISVSGRFPASVAENQIQTRALNSQDRCFEPKFGESDAIRRRKLIQIWRI